MGRVKDMALSQVEDMMLDISALEKRIDDSVDAGESSEERRVLYVQLEELRAKLNVHPLVQLEMA